MDRTMRAAVLHGIDDLRIENVPVPVPGDHDVLVKVSACGVCGSDIPRILTTGTYHFPTIPGHEFGGTVCEVGKHTDESLIGKRVAVIPLIPCRSCKLCETGQFAQCESYDFLGSRNDGGFAEYVKVPKENLVFVPDSVDEDSVAFLEPVSVALHTVQNCGVQFGEQIAVYGLGAIGIFIAQWAKAFGAEQVFAVDVDEAKVKIAREMGLQAVCSRDGSAEEFIFERTGGRGVDRVFEASGSPDVFNQGIKILRTGGVMGLVGRPSKSLEISNDSFEKILRKQLTIKGTWSFEFKRFPRNAWETSLNALKDGKLVTSPVISHRLPLEQTYEAVKIMSEKREFFYKILIKPQA